MYHRSILELGGVFAILVGVGNILVAMTHFLMPRAQLRGAIGVRTAFYESLAKTSTVFRIHYWLVAISSLLGIGVILAFGELVGDQRSGFLCWATVLGVSGAILAAVDFIFVGLKAPRHARRFIDSPEPVRATLLAFEIPHIDPCFLAFGLMGIWSVAANVSALQELLLPKLLAYAGLIGGCLFELAFVGSALQVPLLVDISVGVSGFVIGPVWYIWTGMILSGAK
jgi:hypothetical protein